MKKGIYLQATVGTGGEDVEAVQRAVQQALAGSHEGLTVQVKRVTPAGGQRADVILYIEGEQPAPEDFEALTTGVVRQLWHSSTTERAIGPALSLQHLTEKDDYEDEQDDSGDLVLPPQAASREDSGAVAKEPARPVPAARSEGSGAVAKEPGPAPTASAAPESVASATAGSEPPARPQPTGASAPDSSAAASHEQAMPDRTPAGPESAPPAAVETPSALSSPPAKAAAAPGDAPAPAPEPPVAPAADPPPAPGNAPQLPPKTSEPASQPPAPSRRASKRRAQRKGHSHR